MPKPAKLTIQSVKYPTRWSYSSWNLMQKCAAAYYWQQIRGVKEPPKAPSWQLQRGIDMHKKAEVYLKGEILKLPPDFGNLRKPYAELKKVHPIVEKFWGVDARWRPVNYNSWCVMKMDAAIEPTKKNHYELYIQDLKTGKEYPSHDSQGKLYAPIGFELYPTAELVIVELWYSDVEGGIVVNYEFTPERIHRLKKRWLAEGKKLLSPRKGKPERAYPSNPSKENCRYCYLRADRGGPCHDFQD